MSSEQIIRDAALDLDDGWWTPPPLSKIPAVRLRALIESWLQGGDGTRTLRELERVCGVGERTLGAICRGERQSVSLGVADKVICLGLGGGLYLWLTELGDLYLGDIDLGDSADEEAA